MAAMENLRSLTLDASEWQLNVLDRQDATEWDADARVSRPKMRDGVVGTVVVCRASIPGQAEKGLVKFTIWGPVPEFPDLARVRPVGPVTIGTYAANGKSGFWFQVQALEAVDAPVAVGARRSGGES